ncbi:hypothetical protein MTR67_007155 [Solanum verrucosum]|uniref:Uncharacterized protein n=1 Tax=Solanum verrucosum TaxID=315347 RepID=A0AAF0Q2S7_SOLVR|nr:hypothetical protein MTR67_007155 [Solanum verrucosum]
MKGVMRFGKKGKLSPRYIGPYRISKRIDNLRVGATVRVSSSPSGYAVLRGDSCSDSRSLGSQVEDQGGSISQGFMEEATWEAKENMNK